MSDAARRPDGADLDASPSGPRAQAPAQKPSPGRPREPGSARLRIIDVARDLFCSHGYERTPLRAVSDALGVTKAAIYYHFKAKDDLLVAIVGPLLDRIDDLIDATGPRLESRSQRRDFLARYVDELDGQAGIVALLRDPGVSEHPVGRRFAFQHKRMRDLLGAGDDAASVIRTTTALRALELAVAEFGDAHPRDVGETALNIAIGVLESGARTPA